jgi:hypothetical protein
MDRSVHSTVSSWNFKTATFICFIWISSLLADRERRDCGSYFRSWATQRSMHPVGPAPVSSACSWFVIVLNNKRRTWCAIQRLLSQTSQRSPENHVILRVTEQRCVISVSVGNRNAAVPSADARRWTGACWTRRQLTAGIPVDVTALPAGKVRSANQQVNKIFVFMRSFQRCPGKLTALWQNVHTLAKRCSIWPRIWYSLFFSLSVPLLVIPPDPKFDTQAMPLKVLYVVLSVPKCEALYIPERQTHLVEKESQESSVLTQQNCIFSTEKQPLIFGL